MIDGERGNGRMFSPADASDLFSAKEGGLASNCLSDDDLSFLFDSYAQSYAQQQQQAVAAVGGTAIARPPHPHTPPEVTPPPAPGPLKRLERALKKFEEERGQQPLAGKRIEKKKKVNTHKATAAADRKYVKKKEKKNGKLRQAPLRLAANHKRKSAMSCR